MRLLFDEPADDGVWNSRELRIPSDCTDNLTRVTGRARSVLLVFVVRVRVRVCWQACASMKFYWYGDGNDKGDADSGD